MSYDPSQVLGTRAIQIDLDASSILSDDITTHTATAILATQVYFIDARQYYQVTGTTSGRLSYLNFNGFAFLGGTFRMNTITSVTTMTDESYCGANTRGVSLGVTSVGTGTNPITLNKSWRAFWRIQ